MVAHEASADRHDNDKNNISQIAILPTESEIRSERPEYLPSPLHFSQHPLEGVECIYDTYFRLHRHDTFAEVKHMVKNLLLECSGDDTRRINYTDRIYRQSARARVYSGATVTPTRWTKKHGLEVQIRFKPPADLQRKTVSQRRRWWSATKRLEEGVLLCLITFCNGKGTPMFFTVTKKNIDSQNEYSLITENRSVISVSPTAATTIHDLMALAASSQRSNGLLVEFPGVIPATFMPVLENLQTLLVSRRSALQKWLLEPSSGIPKPSMPPPVYARLPGFTFDLSPVIIDPTISVHFKPGANTARMEEDLKHLTTLDQGQCKALLAGLSREFALIQGPPGTGKSYVGTQLVRVFLANKAKAALGPILVVCHANHALDQFLEHLIAAGVEDIVRIGGNGTSSLLESKNLRTISRQSFRTRSQAHALSLAFKEKELSGHVLLNYLKSASRIQNPDWHSVRDHLHRNYNEVYEQFLYSARNVSKTGSKVAPFDLWLAECEAGSVEPKRSFTSSKLETVLSIAKENVYHLTLEDRSTLVNHWTNEITGDIVRNMSASLRDIENSQTTISLVHEETDRRILGTADVIGLTTTGLAKHASVLRNINAKVVVCEEAAEVLEAHMLGTFMPSVQHLILIGDHEQLRPQIKNHDLFSIESNRGKRYQLDRSLFERLAGQSAGQHWIPITQLNIQRRMRPEISRLVRNTLYPRLVDHADTKSLPSVPSMRKNVFWYHHTNPEASHQYDTEGKSHSNDFEVQMTSALVRHIVRQGVHKSSEIVVLTPFADQLRKLQRTLSISFKISLGQIDKVEHASSQVEEIATKLQNRHLPHQRKDSEQSIQRKVLRIATVDNFQGEEAKVVIISLVRSNMMKSVGFLKTTNRINVLLSRAKHGMYIIGNANTYAHIPMWGKVLGMLEEADAIGPAFSLCCHNTRIEICWHLNQTTSNFTAQMGMQRNV
ncbi:P-loop containing nucleoside triphosphate hydrolase protein [Phaeosphaeriaceae sp. PMI808]|nr:P-loop containing nucleoside triphosphate hydrolase protein [Phaeosphaeriaceae sp. PMI808]